MFFRQLYYALHQVIAMWPKHFDMLNRPEKLNKYLVENTLTADVAAITAENYEKFMIKIKKDPLIVEQLLRKVPRRFHKYIKA